MRRGIVAGACVVAGAAAAPSLSVLWLPGLCWVAALGWSLRRGWSQGLAWFATGLASAAVSWVLPMREPAVLDPERVVTVLIERTGPWRDRGDSFQAAARARTVRQRSEVDLRPLEVMVFWPGQEAPPPEPKLLRMRGYLHPPARFFNGFEEPASRVWFFALESSRLAEAIPSREPPFAHAAQAFCLGWRSALDAALPAAHRGGTPGQSLAGALVLGDAGRLAPSTAAAMRRHGLAHLTAASGLHVGIVAGFWLLLCGAGPSPIRTFVPACAVLLFVAVIGMQPPLARAACCLGFAIAARLVGRLPPAGSVLAFSALALVLLDPRLAMHLGFQLSYAATAGILALERPLDRAMRPLPRWLRGGLAVSLAAQLATTPFLVARFAVLPLAAPLWNLVFVPWTSLLLVVGAVWGCADALWPGTLPPRLLDGLAWPVGLLEHVPPSLGTVLPMHAPLGIGALLASVLAGALMVGSVVAVRRMLAAVSILLIMGLGRGAGRDEASTTRERGDLEAIFLDVGQGDALVLRDGPRTLLVDGGGWPRGDVATRVLLPALARLGVRRLDVALLTHGDHDHCAGLLELDRWIPVRELWVAPTAEDARCGSALGAQGGRRVSPLVPGERRSLGRFEIDVLHAPERAPSTNAGSVVVAVAAGGRRLLLAADIDAAVERALLERGALLAADVLKVAHHGSRTSTSGPFLAAVDPALAIVQAGRDNVYGHPAAVVLERLAVQRTLVLRTDLDGRVVLAWRDGGPWRLATARARRAGVDGPPRLF